MPSFKRDSATIKRIVQKFIKRGNTIISDAWAGYDQISLPNHGYTYIRHVHIYGHGQFGYGDESTLHIQKLWSVLKTIFRRIYVTIPCGYFNLFLREIESKYLISNKNDNEKLNELLDIFDYVSNTANFI